MARPSRPWFRFYVEAVSDVKLRRVTPAQRWLWVSVLAAARQSPQPGRLLIAGQEPLDERDLAIFADMPVKDVRRTMPLFEKAGMLTVDELGAWVVTNWGDRQYESDNVTDRTRKHRSNHPERNGDGTFQPGSREPPITGLGTMTEAEADTEEAAAALRDTSPPPAATVAAAAGTGLVNQALELIAHRRLAGKTQVNTGPGYLRGTVNGLRTDHAARLATLDPGRFPTAQALADWLEPPHQPARKPDPLDATQAATNRIYERNDGRRDRPCPTCTGDRFVGPDTALTPCPHCQATGVAP